MLNAVEVGAEIKIDDSFLPFHNRLVDLQHRFVSCPLRSVSIRPRLKIGFKDRLQDELECPLDHTVTNGRNGKNPDLGAPVFRNFLFFAPAWVDTCAGLVRPESVSENFSFRFPQWLQT